MSPSTLFGRFRTPLAFAAGLLLAGLYFQLGLNRFIDQPATDADNASEDAIVIPNVARLVPVATESDRESVASAQRVTVTRTTFVPDAAPITVEADQEQTSESGNAQRAARLQESRARADAFNRAQGSADPQIGQLYGRIAAGSFKSPSCWSSIISNTHVVAAVPADRNADNNSLAIVSDPDEAADGRTSRVWQTIIPDQYLGERIRITALLLTVAVQRQAYMWVSADDANGNSLAFDNMNFSFTQTLNGNNTFLRPEPRSLRGTTQWSTHEIVIDVPPATYSLHYGFAIEGAGALWVDDVTIARAEPSALVTAASGRAPPFSTPPPIRELTLSQPVNTDFELAGFQNPSACLSFQR